MKVSLINRCEATLPFSAVAQRLQIGEKHMSIYEITFSPIEGTKRASDIFTKAFCSESIHIDLTKRKSDFSAYSFKKEDICIIAVPSYGGRVPDIAVTRLLRLKGNGARAILMVVYGNRAYDDTFAELQDTLTSSGFSCVAGVAAIAEHSIMRQFAAGRPDAQDEKELKDFAGKLRSKMEAGEASAPISFPGKRPYREYGGVPMKPKAGNACTLCGLCAEECPAGAIPAEHPSETDTSACISCMRCIAVCPQEARSVSKALLAAGSIKLKKACGVRKENELFL
jgi:ferredoxin